MPIHPRIMPFVKNRLKKSNEYFLETDEGSKFKKGDFYEEIGFVPQQRSEENHK